MYLIIYDLGIFYWTSCSTQVNFRSRFQRWSASITKPWVVLIKWCNGWSLSCTISKQEMFMFNLYMELKSAGSKCLATEVERHWQPGALPLLPQRACHRYVQQALRRGFSRVIKQLLCNTGQFILIRMRRANLDSSTASSVMLFRRRRKNNIYVWNLQSCTWCWVHGGNNHFSDFNFIFFL